MKTEEMLSSESSKTIPFVKLTDDMLFKDVFGSKKGRIFLEDLLECYYGLESGTMHNKLKVTTEYHHERDNYQEKDTRSDIVVIYEDVFINIEMYRVFNDKSLRKSARYIMKISTSQLEIGDDYGELKKVTQINFIEKDVVNISDKFLSSRDLFGNGDVTMDFVVFDNINKNEYNLSRFSKYVQFMNANSYEEREKVAKGDEKLERLDKLIKEYCDEEKKLGNYDEINWTKEIYEESGRLQGIEQGESNKSLEIAKNLLDMGHLSLEDISKATNLSLEEIEKLKENKN